MSGNDSDSFSDIFSFAKSQAREALGLPAGSPVPADSGDGLTDAAAPVVEVEKDADATATASASGDGSGAGSGVCRYSQTSAPLGR
jgi:hypothetical protein